MIEDLAGVTTNLPNTMQYVCMCVCASCRLDYNIAFVLFGNESHDQLH